MNVRWMKVAPILLLAIVLLGALPVLALGPGDETIARTEEAVTPPTGDQPPEGEVNPPEASTEPLVVPGNATPGFYAARDYRNVGKAEYGVVGGHMTFYWDQLEPTEGAYRWDLIDNFLNLMAAGGKKGALGVNVFNGRANEVSSVRSYDPPLRTPAWVFAAGAKKIVCDGRSGAGFPNPPVPFEIPRYWDPIFKAKYRNFIAALAARYDGDPRLEFVQIGVGKYGETQPADDMDDACVLAALQEDSWTAYTWPYIVNDITDIYADSFHTTRVLLPNAPRFMNEPERRDFTDHAIQRGVGLYPMRLYAVEEWVDLRTKPGWNGVGKLDRILDQVETGAPLPGYAPVPIAFESYRYMTGKWVGDQLVNDPIHFWWAVAGALSRRVDYITMERNILYEGEPNDPVVYPFTDNIEIMRWATQYMGKRVASSPKAPGVWVAMREGGSVSSLYPESGNYTFGLKQDDAAPQGRTKVTTYRQPSQLVSDPATISPNPNIETGQAFLGGPTGESREGWLCRRTDQATSNTRMGFKIDDGFVYGGTSEATIKVTYLDRGTDSWKLVYDASSNAYKDAGTVVKTNTNTWKTRTFTVSDARFSNAQSGATDFYLDCLNDGNEYIHFVEVVIGSGSSTQTFEAPLTTNNGGWNLVSVPLTPSAGAISSFLASINGKYDLVQAFYGGAWHAYPGGDLATVNNGMSLWIHVTQSCTLSVQGTAPTSTAIALSAANGGWNLIGWPSSGSMSITTALAGITGKYDLVYSYDAANTADPWKIYDTIAPGYANDLNLLAPGKGCSIHVTTDCTLTVNY